VSEAGPYFRSRAAAPSDGILGGTSAGYWVLLDSNGAMRIRGLNPNRVVAFTESSAAFDRTAYHRLEAMASGLKLQVKLDGALLEFDEGGKQVRTVSIPAVWEGPPPTGTNRGTAGIAFSINHGKAAGSGRAT